MPVEAVETLSHAPASPSSNPHVIPLPPPTDASHHESAKFKSMGMGSAPPSCTTVHAMNDRFDYEQKYPADEQFQEMAPRARVWKMYEDEGAKYDLEMVADWRDGLDMLLVFAALFSGVVTAFVSQTCRNLQVDYSQVTASLMLQSLTVQHALLAFLEGRDTGLSASAALPPIVSPPFRPKAADQWVNALWFTSLGLSLTTTLMAVLAKQWIHQYISLPSGTPLKRSRIRHYRYEGLQKWRVPLIIGFLPVLMHLSLGLFFIGLVVYLSSLNTAIAVDMACIGGAAYLMYFFCNILPLYHPDCPYKTPLSSYGYAVLCAIRQCHIFSKLKQARASSNSSFPGTLKDLEEDAVEHTAREVDSSALVWLHNATSNNSVQSVVLQAFSALPLECIPVVGASVSGVVTAINSHYRPDQPIERFQRFERAAVRFCGYDIAKGSAYNFHRFSPDHAVGIIQCNLLGLPPWDTWQKTDVLVWGKVFETALLTGIDWLGISHDRPSRLWCALLRYGTIFHTCEQCNCDKRDCELYTFWMPPQTKYPPLVVNTYTTENSTARTLGVALCTNMRPSFIRWLLCVGFSHFKRSSEDYTTTLPDDIFLALVMLQTPCVQSSSYFHEAWFGQGSDCESLFRLVLNVVELYAVGILIGDSDGRHGRDCVDLATIRALQNVVKSDSFITTPIISQSDKELTLRILFKGLTRRIDLFGTEAHDFTWLTSRVSQNIVHVVFASASPASMSRSLVDIFHYLLASGPTTDSLGAIEAIYTNLLKRHWLEGLSVTLGSVSSTPDIDCQDGHRDPLQRWTRRFTPILGALYVSSLPIIAARAPDVVQRVLEHLHEPSNLTTMCKILLIADIDTQAILWKLAETIQLPTEVWRACLQQLSDFAGSSEASDLYSDSFHWVSEGKGWVKPIYLSPDEMPGVAAMFVRDVQAGYYTPPNYQGAKIIDQDELRSIWQQETTRQRYRERWVQDNAHNPTDPRQRDYLQHAEKWYPLLSMMKTGGITVL